MKPTEGAMNSDVGLICGWLFNGMGGGLPVDWSGALAWRPADGVLWLHLDRGEEAGHRWLIDESGLDSIIVDALLAEETRPRSVPHGDGLLVILRGVNLNPGADPEDMVAIRMWIDERRIITMRTRNIMAVSALDEEIRKGTGPQNSADFLVALAAGLVDRIAPVIEDLDDLTDELEDDLLSSESREIRARLRDVRRTAISLRRYLAPQRDAFAHLQSEDVSWLVTRSKARLREITDRVIRYVEDLDEIRERAAVIQDELMNRMSEQMNRNMYLLSVVAAIMLPLGLLTSLLGINVGGIPGADNSFAFLIVCGALACIAALEVLLVRRLHWF